MDAADRAAFIGGIDKIVRDNFQNRETRAALSAVTEHLADRCNSTADACDMLRLVIVYGQAVAKEAYQAMREAA